VAQNPSPEATPDVGVEQAQHSEAMERHRKGVAFPGTLLADNPTERRCLSRVERDVRVLSVDWASRWCGVRLRSFHPCADFSGRGRRTLMAAASVAPA
jgi:pimeloyl-CoA synthetase